MENIEALHPTPFPELNMVLKELVAAIQGNLRENFIGAYLQGSFALGDFDMHSDVDFIVVMEQKLSKEHVAALQVMHKRIYNLENSWAKFLEGSYFPKDVLKHHSQRGRPLWYLDNGHDALTQSEHCNTLVVRWVVREHGVILVGPPPQTLIAPVSADLLRQEIMETLTGWGQEILTEPEQFNNRFYQGFIVLSYCRMLHDLQQGTVGSKHSGAKWAKATIDPSWAGLIDRAWATRPFPSISVRTPADPEDFRLTLEFVRYMLDLSTQMV